MRNWRGKLLAALTAETSLPELLDILANGIAEVGPIAIFGETEPGKPWCCMAATNSGLNIPALLRMDQVLARWRRAGTGSSRSLTALLTDALEPFELGHVTAVTLPENTGAIIAFSKEPLLPAFRARLRRRARLAAWLYRRQQTVQAQGTARRVLDAVVAHAHAGVARYDTDGVIREVNEAYAQMLGSNPADLIGMSYLNLLVSDEDKLDAQTNLTLLSSGQCESLESRRWLRHAGDKEKILVHFSSNLLRDEYGVPEAIVDVVTDITEKQALSDALAYERSHDPLTGLLNRSAFEARVESTLLADRHGTHVLAVMDLDRFGLLNASYGTGVGDLCLARVAERVRAALHRGESAGRLGNDEFGVLLSVSDPRHAVERAKRLAHLAASTPLSPYGGDSARVTVSIGITPLTGSDMAQLLRQAEQAARRARNAGGNQVRLYHPDEPAYSEADRTLAWAAQVQTALDEERLTLVRQPIHALSATQALPACEYLVRLVARSGKLVEPGEFLAAAEHYAMAREIDRWVIDRAASCLGTDPQGLEQMEFASINLSAQSLDDPDLGLFVLSALARHGVPAEKFCLELTETAAVTDIGAARALIRILRAAGCRFALDDFGTGMASFGYLRDLDVDFIKIDGRFVRNIAASQVDRGMVEAMHDIARLTHKRTIAEFVEGPEALACLRAIGVDYAQGYALGRPERLPRHN